MTKNICTLLAFVLLACNNQNKTTSGSDNLDEMVERNTDTSLSEKEKYEYENLQIQFDKPIHFASTKNVALPLIYEEIERDKLDYEFVHFNIAVLTDTSTKPMLIFESPVEIITIETVERSITNDLETFNYSDDYYYENDEDDVQQNSSIVHPAFNSLLFIQVKKPTNNNYTCTTLYLYDLKILQLYQLTEDGTDFISWKSIHNDSKIIITYHIDNNHDNELNDKDDQNMCIYDLKTHALSAPIFDIEMLREMKLNLVKSKQ
ncbi:MAG: hypothetical protein IPM74_00290 [Crocinitomicaceae bacterium]|nr:hypothetical protein [Crocinitomicaceae bacterium]MBK8924359.1 hypothetical protein [Crocinitomicaceae bacterium]